MLVSIVVPIYNTEKYLRRCIDSLIHQTYREIEVWLIDDGSTDSSGSICDEYAATDARVRVYHKVNGGEASARSAGLERASGDYIAFCDSDDEYTLTAIEKLAAAVLLDGVTLAVGAYLEKTGDKVCFACTNQRRRTAKQAMIDISNAAFGYGVGYILSTVNGKLFDMALIRKNKLSFDQDWVIGNDTLFIEKYLLFSGDVLDILEPVYIYYKFPQTERVQGMAWEYPDMFKFFLATKKIQAAVNNEQVLPGVFNGLIGLLVKAAAYEESFGGELIFELKKLMDDPFVYAAAAGYHRTRIKDSRLIPFAFKHKMAKLLLYALRRRAENFVKERTKSQYVRLMFQPLGHPDKQ